MDVSYDTIITHPGGAHKDEFLACCFLLNWNPVAIERREPTQEDLDNPRCAVVDIGHRHEPQKGNFDHHQFPREHPPACALSLVLKHYKRYDDARQFCEWLETLEWFDSRGAVATANHLDVSFEALRSLNSPIDVTMLRMFAAQKTILPDSLLWELMHTIGSEHVSYLQTMHDRMEEIRQHCQTWQFQNANGETGNVLFMPRTDPLAQEPSLGLSFYIEQQNLSYVGLVYPDRRGSGYGLSRFNDHPFFDFCQLEANADVHFTHSRGFLAKTTATEETRLRKLLEDAVVCR
jgi:hypothetical protein